MITKIRDGVNLVNSMLYCFIFTSLAISLIYLLNYDQFLASYNANDRMERSGWTDPNYLSCIIGMGSIVTAKQTGKDDIKTILDCNYISCNFFASPNGFKRWAFGRIS
mgnify:CR=1 FL=1